jgi:leucyl-tRNA synthetase
LHAELSKGKIGQDIIFPTVSPSNPTLTSASNYVRQIQSSIGAAEGAQQKRLAKGKTASYDPKADKKLTIFVAKCFPSWQQKYIDLVRRMFNGVTLDVKEVTKHIDKAEMKKAMPFVQNLKRRLENAEEKTKVFDRDLGFEEVEVLKEMIPGLRATVMKLKKVDIVLVEEGAKGGVKLSDGKEEKLGELPPMAASAEPGSPSFEFSNEV